MIPNYAAVKIAITRPDGGVSIMSFLTVGRGNSLPNGADWLDKAIGSWSRPPTDAVVAEEVARAIPDAVAWQRILDSEVPKDRTFRDALVVKGGALTHDMETARELARDMLRHQRAAVMPELDGEWMRAIGQDKKAEADKIEADRQVWRDAPADPKIDAAQTTGELALIINKG